MHVETPKQESGGWKEEEITTGGWGWVPSRDEFAKYREDMLTITHDVPGEMNKGLNRVQYMFIFQFAVSIILFVAAIYLGAAGLDKTLTYILGAAGGLTLIASLIRTPLLQLQKNRIDLSQWLIVYQNWQNSFFFTQRLLIHEAEVNQLNFEKFKSYNNYLLGIMEKIEACRREVRV